MKIAIQDIYAIEKELIEKRVAPHNRAEHFATLIYPRLYGRKCEDWLGDENHRKLREFYDQIMYPHKLFPKPFIVGFIASLDRVRTFKIQDICGSKPINMFELIGFKTSADLALFCFGQDAIYQQVEASIKNTFIFNNVSIQGISTKEEEEAMIWREATNHMTLISYALENHFENNTVFQNIHLLAELTIKAVLLNKKIKFNRIHNLQELIGKLIHVSPIERQQLSDLVQSFPEFAQSRYSGVDKKFIDIVDMAIKAQTFIAEVVKYSNYDLNSPIEFAKI